MKALLLIAIALFPASYALKFVYDLGVTWINPSFLIGLLALTVHLATSGKFRVSRDEAPIVKASLVFLVAYILSSLRALLMNSALDTGISPSAYECLREPVRLSLCFVLLYLVLATVKTGSLYASLLKASIWMGLLQLCAAVYLLAALLAKWPLPHGWDTYIAAYIWRQSLYVGDLVIPRLGGTFREAPMYGLYMLCALACNILLLKLRYSRLYTITLRVLLIGTVLSLSSQVAIALAVLGLFAYGPGILRYPKIKIRALLAVAAAIIVFGIGIGLVVQRMPAAGNVLSTSGTVNERTFHTANALDRLADQPLLGIGPGLYGYYAAKAGGWPTTVTVQVMIPEILAETGLVGFSAFLLFACVLGYWLWQRRDYMTTGIVVALFAASAFQANWKWDFVFFTLGLVIVFHRFRPCTGETPTSGFTA